MDVSSGAQQKLNLAQYLSIFMTKPTVQHKVHVIQVDFPACGDQPEAATRRAVGGGFGQVGGEEGSSLFSGEAMDQSPLTLQSRPDVFEPKIVQLYRQLLIVSESKILGFDIT